MGNDSSKLCVAHSGKQISSDEWKDQFYEEIEKLWQSNKYNWIIDVTNGAKYLDAQCDVQVTVVRRIHKCVHEESLVQEPSNKLLYGVESKGLSESSSFDELSNSIHFMNEESLQDQLYGTTIIDASHLFVNSSPLTPLKKESLSTSSTDKTTKIKQMKQYIQFYEKMMDLIGQQMNNPSLIFGIAKWAFLKSITYRLQQQISSYNSNKNKFIELQMSLNDFVKEINTFIGFMTDQIYSYFKLSQISKLQYGQLLTYENLYCYVLNDIFKEPNFNFQISLFLRTINARQEMSLKEKIQKMRDKQLFYNIDIFNIKENLNWNWKGGKPFEQVITHFKEIQFENSPLVKYKIVQKTMDMIGKYCKSSKFVKQSMINYVIMNSQITTLQVDCQMMLLFLKVVPLNEQVMNMLPQSLDFIYKLQFE